VLEDDGTLGVYVHVPFCERVCPYCDFPVVAARRLAPEREEAYLSALLAELEQRGAPLAGRRLATLYLGGGTPSLLRAESVARLLGAVRAAFGLPETAEVTLEANPGTTESTRLPAFRAAGVNRLSLGVQSFDDTVLRRLGRAHRGGHGRAALRAARATGFAELSLDLICAAPGQTRETLAADLEEALAFAPEHVSVYELGIEPGTPFALAARRGQLATPDEAECVRMLALVAERLAAAGLERYEISSWARPGHASRHNRRYWERRTVLGLGPGAWSLEAPSPDAPFGARRANPPLDAWQEALARGEPPAPASHEVLGEAVARGEAVFLALRTARGLDAARFAREFGAPPRGFYAAAIDELARAGLLEEAGGGDLRLTARGRLFADTVSAHFVN
jgi:oxygen-independent coproporphyrinogen-3 oxidase